MNINATLFGQAITFAILVWFTMKFVWPPLNKMIEERAKRIADGLAAAEKGNLQLLEAENQVNQELKKVQARAVEIVNNAQRHADQIIELAKTKADQESARIMAEAKANIEQELLKVKESLRLQVADLVVRGAEQILRSEVDQARHEKLLDQLKAEL